MPAATRSSPECAASDSTPRLWVLRPTTVFRLTSSSAASRLTRATLFFSRCSAWRASGSAAVLMLGQDDITGSSRASRRGRGFHGAQAGEAGGGVAGGAGAARARLGGADFAARPRPACARARGDQGRARRRLLLAMGRVGENRAGGEARPLHLARRGARRRPRLDSGARLPGLYPDSERPGGRGAGDGGAGRGGAGRKARRLRARLGRLPAEVEDTARDRALGAGSAGAGAGAGHARGSLSGLVEPEGAGKAPARQGHGAGQGRRKS